MATLAPLLEKTLVVVAHPDDEVIGCGALMQRMQEVCVVFATDGAPLNARFWPKYESREQYASVRRLEASDALAYARVKEVAFLSSPDGSNIADQDLFGNLEAAAESLRAITERSQPKALLTLAYEGGHPDHDCCNFLVNQLSAESGTPAWEMPLYHLASTGTVSQAFRDPDGSELALRPDFQENKTKQLMVAAYSSQADVLIGFSSQSECFRPLETGRYNYFHPPHAGTMNYEAWGWPMTGADICHAFATFMHARLAADRRPA